MKLLLAAAATTVLAGAPAVSHSLALGSYARSCFLAAAGEDVSAQAFDSCDRAIQEEPLSFEDRVASYVNRGIVEMNGGRHAAAEADFDAALKLDAREAEAWLNKGLLRLRQERASEAMPMLERAIKGHLRNPALAIYARAMANEQLGNIRAAYADLKQARDLEPRWSLPSEDLRRYHVR